MSAQEAASPDSITVNCSGGKKKDGEGRGGDGEGQSQRERIRNLVST